jgi:PsbP
LKYDKKFCVIAVLVTISLVSQALAFQSASASNQTENKSGQLGQPTTSNVVGWQTHEDSENGFKIQYPQEWKTVTPLPELSERTVFDVSSDPGGGRQQSSVSVYVEDASRQLNPETLKVQSTPLEQRANSLIAVMGFNQPPNIIKNEATTFNGEPAWRVDYIMNINGYQVQYGTNIFVYKNDKLYQIDFKTNPLKVEEMRPVGEKIIQSFQFTNNTNNTSSFQFTNNTDNERVNDPKIEESKDDGGAKDCSDFDETNFKVQPGDPYGLDPDGDGIACEG